MDYEDKEGSTVTPYESCLVVVRRTEVTHQMDGAILFLMAPTHLLRW